MLNFIISALATWRISNLLVNEEGPGDIFGKLRNIVGVKYDTYSQPYGTGFLSGILSCLWCCSVWVAVFIAILEKPANIRTFIRRALAFSTMAIVLDVALEHLQKDGR